MTPWYKCKATITWGQLEGLSLGVFATAGAYLASSARGDPPGQTEFAVLAILGAACLGVVLVAHSYARRREAAKALA